MTAFHYGRTERDCALGKLGVEQLKRRCSNQKSAKSDCFHGDTRKGIFSLGFHLWPSDIHLKRKLSKEIISLDFHLWPSDIHLKRKLSKENISLDFHLWPSDIHLKRKLSKEIISFDFHLWPSDINIRKKVNASKKVKQKKQCMKREYENRFSSPKSRDRSYKSTYSNRIKKSNLKESKNSYNCCAICEHWLKVANANQNIRDDKICSYINDAYKPDTDNTNQLNVYDAIQNSVDLSRPLLDLTKQRHELKETKAMSPSGQEDTSPIRVRSLRGQDYVNQNENPSPVPRRVHSVRSQDCVNHLHYVGKPVEDPFPVPIRDRSFRGQDYVNHSHYVGKSIEDPSTGPRHDHTFWSQDCVNHLHFVGKPIRDPSPSPRRDRSFRSQDNVNPLLYVGQPVEDPSPPSDGLGLHFKKGKPLFSKFMSPEAGYLLTCPLVNVKLENLKYETLRIKTFQMSRIRDNMYNWVLKIASTGFYLSGDRGEVTCFSCNRQHYDLLARTSLSDAHEPECNWHETNIPLTYFTRGLSSNELQEFYVALGSNFRPKGPPPPPSVGVAPDGHGAHGATPATAYAVNGESGFYSTNTTGTSVVVAYTDSSSIVPDGPKSRISQEQSADSCHKMLTSATDKEPFDYEMGQHLGSPRNLAAGSTLADGGSTTAGHAGDSWDLSGASYPQFASQEARKETFKYWDPNHKQKPDDLVALGFFFSGYSDCARCFYCGLGLKYWRPHDNAAYQHARYRPHCLYNRLVKGQEFIDSVQRIVNQKGTSVGSVTVPDGDSHLLECSAAVTAISRGWSRDVVIRAIKIAMSGAEADLSTMTYSHLLHHLENFHGGSLNSSTPSSRPGSPSQDEGPILECQAVSDALSHGWDREDVISIVKNMIAGSQIKLDTLKYSELEPELQKMKEDKQDLDDSEGMRTSEPTVSADSSPAKSGNAKFQDVPEPLDDLARIHLAEQEHEKLKNKMYCMVCKLQRIGCVFLPCGHVVACQECGERANNCSLCSKHVIALANIYLS